MSWSREARLARAAAPRPCVEYVMAPPRAVGAMLLAVAFVLGAPGAVRASCGVSPAGPASLGQQLAGAPVVFVGKVVSTSDNNRSAHVSVESVWKGPDLPAHVDVHGEAPGSGPFSGSEADHSYQPGRRYLFAPLNAQSPFEDYGECGILTQPYSADVAVYAPADARSPRPPTLAESIDAGVGQYPWTVAAVTLVALGFAAVLIARRQRRRWRPRRR